MKYRTFREHSYSISVEKNYKSNIWIDNNKNFTKNCFFYEIFQVLKATTMTSVMYLQELKTKNTQVDKNMELGTKHVSQISTNKQPEMTSQQNTQILT